MYVKLENVEAENYQYLFRFSTDFFFFYCKIDKPVALW